ncbi:MAG: hydantoinase/carbamoylase family amidase [Rhizobiaceae bacterium]|nr:hydantoinase/carbamoylase family amidase [Rhizobiaceae bacterium]
MDGLAASFLADLEARTADPPGVTRQAYGSGEAAAHRLLAAYAGRLGLPVETDRAGNLYVTLRGRDPAAPVWMIGSHLDSVPHGGNFDGGAGVAAGLAVLAEIKRRAVQPRRSIVLVAIRAEESTWFPASYIGSRAAFGLLAAPELDLKRSDTGETLAVHMRREGFPPERLLGEPGYLDPARLHGFIEVHIEQGPTLVLDRKPIGLVSAIAGSFRYRSARVRGAYGHSGAVARRHRHDAVFAFADMVAALDRLWADLDAAGKAATITLGEVSTDPEMHAFSKIPGELCFSLDVRSGDSQVLAEIRRDLEAIAKRIEDARGVSFDFGLLTASTPAVLDAGIREALAEQARRHRIGYVVLPSGAGHDAAVFAQQGVATAMIFVRNENGSHNPDEAMQLEDLGCALTILVDLLAE